MIKQMQKGESAKELSFGRWDVGIVSSPIDDRGREAVDFIQQNVTDQILLEYNAEDVQLILDGQKIRPDDLDIHLQKFSAKSVLLETTTLGFAEIILICRSLRNLGFPEVSFLYIEPARYRKARQDSNRIPILKLKQKRDFELSDLVAGYRAIPGFARLLTSRKTQKVVFFLGFESERLERALEEQEQITPAQCAIVFGVPAFRPGMEIDAFSNNIRVLKEKGIREIYFTGAENPFDAAETLREIHNGLQDDEELLVVPIGTKPHGIASAVFAATNPGVAILFDHPKRKKDRTTEIASWHLFTSTLL